MTPAHLIANAKRYGNVAFRRGRKCGWSMSRASRSAREALVGQCLRAGLNDAEAARLMGMHPRGIRQIRRRLALSTPAAGLDGATSLD